MARVGRARLHFVLEIKPQFRIRVFESFQARLHVQPLLLLLAARVHRGAFGMRPRRFVPADLVFEFAAVYRVPDYEHPERMVQALVEGSAPVVYVTLRLREDEADARAANGGRIHHEFVWKDSERAAALQFRKKPRKRRRRDVAFESLDFLSGVQPETLSPEFPFDVAGICLGNVPAARVYAEIRIVVDIRVFACDDSRDVGYELYLVLFEREDFVSVENVEYRMLYPRKRPDVRNALGLEYVQNRRSWNPAGCVPAFEIVEERFPELPEGYAVLRVFVRRFPDESVCFQNLDFRAFSGVVRFDYENLTRPRRLRGTPVPGPP